MPIIYVYYHFLSMSNSYHHHIVSKTLFAVLLISWFIMTNVATFVYNSTQHTHTHKHTHLHTHTLSHTFGDSRIKRNLKDKWQKNWAGSLASFTLCLAAAWVEFCFLFFVVCLASESWGTLMRSASSRKCVKNVLKVIKLNMRLIYIHTTPRNKSNPPALVLHNARQ